VAFGNENVARLETTYLVLKRLVHAGFKKNFPYLMPSCPLSGICPKQVPKVWHQRILFRPISGELMDQIQRAKWMMACTAKAER
jgi:hypothetical protein